MCARELCICPHVPFYNFSVFSYIVDNINISRENGGCSYSLIFRWHYIHKVYKCVGKMVLKCLKITMSYYNTCDNDLNSGPEKMLSLYKMW